MFRTTALRPLATAIPLSRSFAIHTRTHARQSLSQPIGGRGRLAFERQSYPVAIQKAHLKTTPILCAKPRVTGADFKDEQEKLRHEKLKPDPEGVSPQGSIRQVFDRHEPSASTRHHNEKDPDMMNDVWSDLKVVQETFALKEVPKEVYWFGMGGLAPYVITSASTLFLAWDINGDSTWLVSKDTAIGLLHSLEPVQVGLGAIILSFLGAVHWGLEMAQYGGSHPYRRYTIGILAPALAWPTVLLPLDAAILTQFVGFVGMYFADSQATAWGWAPHWYTTYRFVLTAVVGVCIIVTLVGRGQIGDSFVPRQGAARHHFEELKAAQRANKTGRIADEQKSGTSSSHQNNNSEQKKEADNEKQHDDSNKGAADPGKRAKGDQPGKQGVYSDDLQGTSGTSTPGQPTDPSPEKKGIQQPQTEGKTTTATRG